MINPYESVRPRLTGETSRGQRHTERAAALKAEAKRLQEEHPESSPALLTIQGFEGIFLLLEWRDPKGIKIVKIHDGNVTSSTQEKPPPGAVRSYTGFLTDDPRELIRLSVAHAQPVDPSNSKRSVKIFKEVAI